MDTEQQFSEEDDLDHKESPLAGFTMNQLLCEIKSRCLALAAVMVVDDDDGGDMVVTCTMGSRLQILGAAEVIRQEYLTKDVRQLLENE